MNFEEVLQLIQPYRRHALIPKVEEVNSICSSHSKFGGLPYLNETASWPQCPNCENKMSFFFQLNTQEIPLRQETGIVQLFYCTSSEPHCEGELESFFPFSKASVVRRVQETGVSVRSFQLAEISFPERRIISWERVEDYPSWEELYDLGIEMPNEFSEEDSARLFNLNVVKDKLGGWPSWVQGAAYPRKANEQVKYSFYFQLISDGHLDYMFGDMGIGFITVHPQKMEELAFGWSSS